MVQPLPNHDKPCKRFQNFLYNKEQHVVCNRTGRNWLRLFYQYTVFHILIHLLFLILLYNINMIVQREDPVLNKLQLIESVTPTITIVPIRVNTDLPEPIIWFVSKGEDEPGNRRASAYIEAIDTFFKENERECKKFPNTTCVFQRKDFGPCGLDDFGYNTFQPCLFIKLNKIEGWRPLDYTDIPKDYPPELKTNIDKNRSTVWVLCKGDTIYDEDHIGSVIYYPSQGFKDEYFPYMSKDEKPQLNPVLAIQLRNIEVGVVLTLRCGIFSREKKDHISKIFIYMEK